MAEKQKIFVAYCYAEKKWLDRAQSALAPLAPAGSIVVWDESKLRTRNWRTDLPVVLQESTIAVIMVSELFLESDFIRRARLPAMLEKAAAAGLNVRWILATHCLYEAAGFQEAQALNELDQPLDALSVTGREAVAAEIGRRLRMLVDVAEPPRPETPPSASPIEVGGSDRKAQMDFPKMEAPKSAPSLPPEPDPAPTQPYVRPLGEVIEMRVQTMASLRRMARGLWIAAGAIILVSFLVAAVSGSTSLLLLVAGFGVCVAMIVFALHRLIDYFGQGIIGLRYVKTAMGDGGLPTRQREALVQKVGAILGQV